MQTKLLISPEKQAFDKSCWACCTRMIYNFYAKSAVYDSDQKLATKVGLTVSDFQNVQAALEGIGIYDGQDDTANLPSMADIKEAVYTNGQALIHCLSTKKVSFSDDVSEGHYVVIAGFDDRNDKLYIIDPATGVGQWVDYGGDQCVLSYSMYWGSTYYTSKPSI